MGVKVSKSKERVEKAHRELEAAVEEATHLLSSYRAPNHKRKIEELGIDFFSLIGIYSVGNGCW